MALFGQTQRQFIARPAQAKDQILYKWPDQNIPWGAQLTVEADELAVFFRDGKVQGTVPPGRVTLQSSDIPFLGALVDAATGGRVLLSELYFILTRELPNLPFGGAIDNVMDPQTQLGVGLGVFGEFSLKVIEPQSLIVNLVGTQNLTSNDEVVDWAKEQLLKVLRTDVVSEIYKAQWPVLGIAAHTTEVEDFVLKGAQNYVNTYGLQVMRLGNFTISIKPEDEATLKDLLKSRQYTQLAGGFQQYSVGEALQGIGKGAAAGGGGESSPAILGLGLGLGGMAFGAGNQSVQQGQAPAVQVRCPACGVLNPEAAKFCSGCGGALAAPQAAGLVCPKCHAQNQAGAKFCESCGEPLAAPAEMKCPQCGTDNAPGAKFCSNCGHSFEAPPAAPPA